MAVNVAIQTSVKNAQRKLKKLGGALDTEIVGILIGTGFVDWIDKNFASEGSLGGKPWEKLSENTVANRRAGSDTILQNIGDLKRSFQWDINRGGNTFSVDIGTPVPYAKYHEDGTKPYKIRPRTKKALKFKTAGGFVIRKSVNHPGLPQRKMLPSDSDGNDIAKKILRAYVKTVVAGLNTGAI